MKVLLINSVCGIGSTGKICGAIAEDLAAQGHQVVIAYGRDGTVPERYLEFAHRIGSDVDVKCHGVYSRLLDGHAFGSRSATKKFLTWAEDFDPDLVWLHNLHGYYLNVEQLFDWIKGRPEMQVKWTLHDCWAFTGHCAYFSMAGCDRWKTGCGQCPQKGSYPASLLLDRSAANFTRKKNAFTGVKHMTLITPSQWLAELVKQSFLGEYPIAVCPNTVDTEIFRPTPSDLRQRMGLEGKRLILGVASVWEPRKGLNDFLELRRLLDDRYAIVLVGLSEKQIAALPPGVLGIARTHDARQLAQLYTAADVYVNPSREETFGMTTLEAVCCGTPAIVYQDTACEEVARRHGGLAVEPNARALARAVLERIPTEK